MHNLIFTSFRSTFFLLIFFSSYSGDIGGARFLVWTTSSQYTIQNGGSRRPGYEYMCIIQETVLYGMANANKHGPPIPSWAVCL